MACPPGNCAAWGAFRLCKPLPPIVLDGSYTPDELQLLWFCWRARSTGEYGGSTPVDLGFDTPGLIDISKTTNLAKVIAYCDSRGTLVRQFTNFSRFGVKFNLPNFQVSGSFSTWSGGVFGGATSPGGGGAGEDPVRPDPTGGGTSGGGGATCGCIPDDDNELTVAVCRPLDCEESSPSILLTVCGGTPPYQWSTLGGEGNPEATQSGTNNRNVQVVSPSRPNVSGVAYSLGLETTRQAECPNPAFQHTNTVGCDDVELSGCAGPSSLSATFQVVCAEGGEAGCPGFPECPVPEGPCGSFGLCCPFDRRTQQMKDDGCLPCSISMEGLNITVEDNVGDTVVTVISL